MNKYCPIVDRVTFLEAVANGWVADYREYVVLIDVDDIETYKNYNKEWIEHFEFFGLKLAPNYSNIIRKPF